MPAGERNTCDGSVRASLSEPEQILERLPAPCAQIDRKGDRQAKEADMQKRWTFTWLVVLGLAVVAIGAAAAQAATRPDDRAGPLGVGTAPVRPDDRAGLRGAAPDQSDAISRYLIRHAGSTAVRPDDRAGPLGVGTPEPSIQIVESSGFDWGDAGLGAGITAALVVLALGAMLLLRSNRHRRSATAAVQR
jgi:hypothetical protein